MSKAFEEKDLQMQNEMKFLKKSHEESTANLKIELKKSQEMSKTLKDELVKSQKSQEGSSKNLEIELRKSQEMSKKLGDELVKSQVEQKESNKELKKLYEESSKEIHDLKENISEIMTLLKSEKEGPRVSKNLEVSLTNNESTFNGIVSNDDLCIPPEVMTSHSTTTIMDSSLSVVKRTSEEGQSERDAHSISDLSTVTNHNSFNLDVDVCSCSTPSGGPNSGVKFSNCGSSQIFK